MEHVQLEPVIIEDLVKYGEDIGFDRGFGQGIDQGIDRGAAQERVRMLSMRLGRPLTQLERDLLVQRLATTTTERFYGVMFSATPEMLEAWIADPNAK
jgi:hypothetical protein